MSRRRKNTKRGGGRVTSPATNPNTSAVETDTSNLAERRGIEHKADLAFETGRPTYGMLGGTQLVIVPDTFAVECFANHGEFPDNTYRIVRADGRVAYLFTWSENLAVPR